MAGKLRLNEYLWKKTLKQNEINFLSSQNESDNNQIGPRPPPPPTSNGTNNHLPSLPPKKIQPDPDYEVIEFSGQQYSNAVPAFKNAGKF